MPVFTVRNYLIWRLTHLLIRESWTFINYCGELLYITICYLTLWDTDAIKSAQTYPADTKTLERWQVMFFSVTQLILFYLSGIKHHVAAAVKTRVGNAGLSTGVQHVSFRLGVSNVVLNPLLSLSGGPWSASRAGSTNRVHDTREEACLTGCTQGRNIPAIQVLVPEWRHILEQSKYFKVNSSGTSCKMLEITDVNNFIQRRSYHKSVHTV